VLSAGAQDFSSTLLYEAYKCITYTGNVCPLFFVANHNCLQPTQSAEISKIFKLKNFYEILLRYKCTTRRSFISLMCKSA